LGAKTWKTSRRTRNAGIARITIERDSNLSVATARPEGTRLKEAVEPLNRDDRTSTSKFVATAVAEKVSAVQGPKFFADRRARGF
jgi:hypothetical protein